MSDAEMNAVKIVLEFAEKWADGKRRDRETFEEAAPLVRALCVPAPPSGPAAPEKEIANLLGRGHVENPREGEPGDAETYSSPAALLPRVLAALTGAAIDAASHGHVKTARDRNDLAAELRAYIAETEGKT